MELGMGGKWQWNPLAAHWLDAYSLAYTVSSLLNQLFGKGKDPFWQQAYTNLVKWIIELHRIFPDRWVTLQDVYHCAINPDLFKEKIDEAGVVVYVQLHGEVVISDKDWKAHKDALLTFGSWNELEDGECKASKTPALEEWLQTEGDPIPRHSAQESYQTGTSARALAKCEDLVRPRLDEAGPETADLVCRGHFQFPVSL